MKFISVLISLLIFNVSSTQADTLLPYIEQPIELAKVSLFSASKITFKQCATCQSVSLTAADEVEYVEHGQPISWQRAQEIFISKKHSFGSVFYTRSSGVFDRVSFGSMEFIGDRPMIKVRGN